MHTIDDLLNSDIQTADSRDIYLQYAKNIQSGHNSKLDLTGNSFNVSLSLSGVHIENLWDEEAELITIKLEEFIEIISNWHPKKLKHRKTRKYSIPIDNNH